MHLVCTGLIFDGGVSQTVTAQCLPTPLDSKPYCHSNATSQSLSNNDHIVHDNCLTVQWQSALVGAALYQLEAFRTTRRPCIARSCRGCLLLFFNLSGPMSCDIAVQLLQYPLSCDGRCFRSKYSIVRCEI